MLLALRAVDLDRPGRDRAGAARAAAARPAAPAAHDDDACDFVDLWVYLSATPLFGLTATLGVYVRGAGGLRAARTSAPWANPVLWTVLALAAAADAHRHALPDLLLRRAVHPLPARPGRGRAGLAAVAAPRRAAPARRRAAGWRRWPAARPPAAARWPSAGRWACRPRCCASLAPKSVTAPVAMGIAAQLGGIPALAAVFAVLTGLVGAISGQVPVRRAAHRPARRCAASRSAPPRTASARRARCRCTPTPAPTPALALGLQVVLAALLMPLVAPPASDASPIDPPDPCKPTSAPEFKGTRDGEAAEAILRKCVHCGFCTATCPTYQLLGDELDGPRGRIYLMKQVLEGARRHAQDAAAPGPLPDLPQLRDHLPQRRAVRPPGRHRPQDRRRAGRAPGRREGGALAAARKA